VHDHPQAVDGLVLMAAYPAESASLRDQDIPVLSLFGTRDGVATPADIEQAAHLLPADTLYIPIAGGNHAQFGYYADGIQQGDNPPDIAHEEQQQIVVQAILDFILPLANPALN
jgi:pimeloyl-ACP methyl ester carboxylesterase